MLSKRTAVLMMFVILLIQSIGQTALASSELKVDVRHRPPEMVVDGESISGPLVDIIKEVAEKFK